MKRANRNVLYLPRSALRRAVKRFPTPFFIYEEARIRANCRRFVGAFRACFPDFAPLFAVKANTNPELLRIVFSEGFGADASSEAEAWVTRKLGASGMYSGNYTTESELRFVRKTGLLLNLDDISLLPALKRVGIPPFLSFRVNPGISKGGMKSLFLAGPDAKYGLHSRDVVGAYRQAAAMGVKRFGIHMMTGSNVLEEDYFVQVTAKLLDIATEVKKQTGLDFEILNIGGGFGMPYRPEERNLDMRAIARGIRDVFNRYCRDGILREPRLMAEPGRLIMADAGWLVGRANVIKKSYKTFVGIDAGMNDLPRPAIYDAYHHISVLGKSARAKREKVNVVGRLCENNDQFAKDRLLPHIVLGDIIVIHNAGAHAYAMGHNYNNRPRSAEYLITKRKALRRIRRAETTQDLFRTTTLAYPEKRRPNQEY